ncbi:hypothetical protein [Vibrio gigantis]|uniref:hypothetical protein n=1 Tax=Vibrio gigantis TaxID=296199 RepID=UPI001BFD155F|nr:hypothetical protein [Vibrio gigantis]
MFSQHIKNNIKNSISLMFILFIIIPSLTACGGGGGGGGGDTKNEFLTKKLEKITIEEVHHKNVLESHEAMSNKMLIFRAIGHYSDESTSDITSSVEWSSSQSNIASFYQPAQLRTYQVGKTSIIAKAKNISATWSLSILEPIAITISSRVKPFDFENNQILYVPKETSISLDSIVEWNDGSKRDGANYVLWIQTGDSFAQNFSEKNCFRATGDIGEITSLTANFDGFSSNEISLSISDAQLKKIIIRPVSNYENTTKLNNALYGTSREFTAMGVYQGPRDTQESKIDITKDVKWASSAPDIFNNAEGNNIFTTSSEAGTSKAIISARMFDVESNAQEMTIADAKLESVEIIGEDNFNNLVNNIEFSLSAVGHYKSNTLDDEDITADITSFVNWSSSDDKVLKQTGHNTFIPIKESNNISVTAEINGKGYKVSKKFNVVAGKLKSITISEIHNYPNHPVTNTVPYNKSRTYKAIGEYTINNSSDTVSLDITDNVKWQLDQDAEEEAFRLSGSTVLAVSHNQSSAAIFAIGDNKTKVTSNLIKLTNIDFNKAFTLGTHEYSLSEFMTSRIGFRYHYENGFAWGISTWQDSVTSCKDSGKSLASEEELQTIQATIGDVGNAFGWPVGNGELEYWTSNSGGTPKSHVSKNMNILGGSYIEEDWIENASICVSDID